MENVLSDTADERQEGDRRGGSDPDPGRNLHLYIECIDGKKFL